MRIVAALLGMAVPAVWLAMLLAQPDEAVRIRTSLVATIGQAADFEWRPDNVPRSFLRNNGLVPPLFREAASAATAGLAPTDQPIRSDVATSYAGIIRDGHGYCADFTKVFNALSIGTGVAVREWGFAFAAFGSGHAFNEVFDATRQKWVLVDSFHSLYFVDPSTREPLSVLEVHDRLLGLDPERRSVSIERIVPARFPFRSDQTALDYYRRGMPQLFLVWGNNVFDYERAPAVRLTSGISRSVQQLVGIVVGGYPRIKIYPIGLSDRDLDELFRQRNQFLVATALLALSLVICGLQLWAALNSRRGERTGRGGA
jgi:hypothetical protein